MINVLPANDLEEHEESSACPCRPAVELINDELLVVHNSYDHREIVEQAYDVLEE